jgi:hypothetical protein
MSRQRYGFREPVIYPVHRARPACPEAMSPFSWPCCGPVRLIETIADELSDTASRVDVQLHSRGSGIELENQRPWVWRHCLRHRNRCLVLPPLWTKCGCYDAGRRGVSVRNPQPWFEGISTIGTCERGFGANTPVQQSPPNTVPLGTCKMVQDL